MAEQPIALLPFYQGWVCLSGYLRKALLGDCATRPPTTYETIRGACRSAEDHLHPVLQGEGPTGGQRASLGLRERMTSHAQQITHD